MQPARARVEVEDVGQADHARQAARHVLPRERRGADYGRGREGLERGVGLRLMLIARVRGHDDGRLGLGGGTGGDSGGGRRGFDNPHPDGESMATGRERAAGRGVYR